MKKWAWPRGEAGSLSWRTRWPTTFGFGWAHNLGKGLTSICHNEGDTWELEGLCGGLSFSPSPQTRPGHPNLSPGPVQVAFHLLSRVSILPPRSVFCIASSHAVLSHPPCVLAFQFLEPAMGSQLQGLHTCCRFCQGCPSFPFSPGYCLLLQVSAEWPSSGQPYLSASTRSGLSFQALTAPSLFFPQVITVRVLVYISIRDCPSH